MVIINEVDLKIKENYKQAWTAYGQWTKCALWTILEYSQNDAFISIMPVDIIGIQFLMADVIHSVTAHSQRNSESRIGDRMAHAWRQSISTDERNNYSKQRFCV